MSHPHSDKRRYGSQVIVVKILLVLKLQFVMQKSILSFLLELYLYCVQISIMLELKLELLEKKIRGINVRKIINIPNAPKQLMKILLDAGYEAYVVGGCVRDFLLNRDPHDWDICTKNCKMSIYRPPMQIIFIFIIAMDNIFETATIISMSSLIEISNLNFIFHFLLQSFCICGYLLLLKYFDKKLIINQP